MAAAAPAGSLDDAISKLLKDAPPPAKTKRVGTGGGAWKRLVPVLLAIVVFAVFFVVVTIAIQLRMKVETAGSPLALLVEEVKSWGDKPAGKTTSRAPAVQDLDFLITEVPLYPAFARQTTFGAGDVGKVAGIPIPDKLTICFGQSTPAGVRPIDGYAVAVNAWGQVIPYAGLATEARLRIEVPFNFTYTFVPESAACP